MWTRDDIARLQLRFGLSYHVAFAQEAQLRVGLAGKRVLEVGGSLPREFALDFLGASSWIAVEETQYWDEVARADAAANKSWSSAVPLSDVSPDELDQRYTVLTGRIEQSPSVFNNYFDVAFSIAAFEHIDRLPTALDAIYRSLRPGGTLFSMFSPVWSSSIGHHLPVLQDADGKVFDQSLIPPWGHLLMRPSEMHQHLRRHTDAVTAGEVVYYIYNSPHINRLFVEDYLLYVSNSQFKVSQFSVTFAEHIDASLQKRLEHLHPGRTHFATQGICLVLKRPENA